MVFLDTDIMIDILREFPPAIDWLGSLNETEIILSGLVVMEVIQGCRNKTEQRRAEKIFGKYEIVWPSPETCNKALSVFTQKYLRDSIGIIDSLIGQNAVDLNIPLFTFNRKHYKAIPKLRTIQPYLRS